MAASFHTAQPNDVDYEIIKYAIGGRDGTIVIAVIVVVVVVILCGALPNNIKINLFRRVLLIVFYARLKKHLRYTSTLITLLTYLWLYSQFISVCFFLLTSYGVKTKVLAFFSNKRWRKEMHLHITRASIEFLSRVIVEFSIRVYFWTETSKTHSILLSTSVGPSLTLLLTRKFLYALTGSHNVDLSSVGCLLRPSDAFYTIHLYESYHQPFHSGLPDPTSVPGCSSVCPRFSRAEGGDIVILWRCDSKYPRLLESLMGADSDLSVLPLDPAAIRLLVPRSSPSLSSARLAITSPISALLRSQLSCIEHRSPG